MASSRRVTNLRPGGPQPGDRVKVLGGNVCLGAVGIYLDDGTTDFGTSIRNIDPHRLVVIELGTIPIGTRVPRGAPQPTTHNYRQGPQTAKKKHEHQVQRVGRKIMKPPLPWGEEGPIDEDDKEFLEEEARRDQKRFNPQPTKIQKKGENRRRGGADWGFD